MAEQVVPKLAKWPFIAGDVLLLGCAFFIVQNGAKPIGLREVAIMVACVAAGAVLSILPFLIEYRAAVTLCATGTVTDAMEKLQSVEQLATQVTSATNQWNAIQSEAQKAATAAKTVADGMAAELKTFTEFMSRANDAEKGNLRLEVEKLKRGEAEWLQVLVRVLDHVFALHQGAVRSGQQRIIDQIGRFQHSCYDSTRRVGLMPFVATPEEPFDSTKHQLVDEAQKLPEDPKEALVGETLATGYTFQGRILRPALVRLQAAKPPEAKKPEEPQLPLGG